MLQYEAKREAGRRVDSASDYLSDHLWNYVHDKDRYNYTYENFTDAAETDLRTFVSFVVNMTKEYNYDGNVEGWETSWTTPKALLFCITIMATIGYGHIYPVTLMGQLFTIIYSLFAIGVFFMFLTNVTVGLTNSLTFIYSRLCCRCFRSQRVKSEIPSIKMQRKLRRRLADEEVGDEVYMPTNTIPIPIIISLMVLLLYITVGAFVFNAWEGWDLLTALYFSFITLTTIGFGDYSPEQSFVGIADPDAGFNEYFQIIFTTIYCAIGLAVISLCLTLIQEQVGRSAAIALGIKGEVVEMDVVEIVPRRPDFLNSDEPAKIENAEDNNESDIPVVAPVASLPGESDEIEDEEEEDEDEEEEEEDEDEDDEDGEDEDEDEEDKE